MKDVERVQVLEVSPDSVVVIESPGRMSQGCLERCQRHAEQMFAPGKVVILEAGARLAGVVKPDGVKGRSEKGGTDGTN